MLKEIKKHSNISFWKNALCICVGMKGSKISGPKEDHTKLMRIVGQIQKYMFLKYHLSPVTCYLSPVTSDMLHVTCHRIPVRFHQELNKNSFSKRRS